jgi:putative acetyltransferase
VEIRLDRSPPVAVVRELMREYAASLSFDLGFDGFEAELAGLPGSYGPPAGALLVAYVEEEPAGCAALRRLDDGSGELKRLFVRPSHRGLGLGRRLTETAIATARELGYPRLRLDTAPEMAAAQGMYRTLGFSEIEPYRHNPVPGARYFELVLETPSA